MSLLLAKFEQRPFLENCKVWIKKYRNLCNSPHWHFESEMIVCLEGNATISLNDRFYTLQAGMCIFCPSESPHYIISSADSLIFVAQIEKSLLPKPMLDIQLQFPLFPDRYHVSERLPEIYNELKDQSLFFADKVNSSMLNLLIDIFRGEKYSVQTGQESTTTMRYRELLAAIEESSDYLTFRDAAAHMNMSDAYFSRFFKKATGMTFSHYLNVVKIGKAIEILSELPDITMAELMSKCGFNTLRHFNRVFKEVTGYAPTQLPSNYALNIRSFATKRSSFDPTSENTIILP